MRDKPDLTTALQPPTQLPRTPKASVDQADSKKKIELPVNANIEVEDGTHTYYQVRLQWLPREGDVIDLFSFHEQAATGQPSRYQFQVVKVVHNLYDLTEAYPDGHHFVTVKVTRR